MSEILECNGCGGVGTAEELASCPRHGEHRRARALVAEQARRIEQLEARVFATGIEFTTDVVDRSKRLEQALREFGMHKATCPRHVTRWMRPHGKKVCNCGLDAALAGGEG